MKQLAIALLALSVLAPTPGLTQTKSIVGTISGFKPEAAEIEVKPDAGVAMSVKLTPDTVALRIAPGEKDLKKAESIKVTDVAIGDKVLVTLAPGGSDIRRIVVMQATDIEKRNQADRQDWNKRGVSGIVAAKNGSEITLKNKSLTGAETQTVVTVGDKTTFKRYAPDSVKFADAKTSKIAEIAIGDQVRARGQKSDDGLKVTADDVVFGTFLTVAGAITAVNPEANEVTIKDSATGKPLVIKVIADSQLKKMPDLSMMMGTMRGGGTPGGAPNGAAAGARGGAAGRGMPDISQMLDMMPPGKLEDMKPGETIIVSSTKGAHEGQITAITLLSHADMLMQILALQSGAGRGAAGGMQGMGGAGGMGAMGGMDLSSMGMGMGIGQ